jgi:imidazolonepropionase
MSDTLIYNIGQLLTMRTGYPGPLRGKQMEDTEVLEHAAVYIRDGRVQAIGPSADLLKVYKDAAHKVDAEDRMVTPGLVDPHTHLVHAGSRENELAQKVAGVPYLDILAGGGGILSSVRSTRAATLDELVKKAKHSLKQMNALGVTTVEAKSGYGLDFPTEERQLQATARLRTQQPVHLVSTFLGAHAVPPEFKRSPDDYLDSVIAMLPAIHEQGLAQFCDVFCETGVFTVEQSRRLLAAAQEVGLAAKIHADEIVSLGGAELAAELGAVSADHLIAASDEGLEAMAKAGTIAVVLPGTSWNLGKPGARAREMIDRFGLPVAVATDYNPGSCPTENLQLVMCFATHQLKLTPNEVFAAVTRNAAHAILAGDRAGIIDVGRPADLVLWHAKNPAYMMYHFGVNHADTVWIDGNVAAQGGVVKWA